MYGFSLEYPDTWEVEIGPRSTAAAGDLAFRTRGIRIFLSWGPLEGKLRKFGSLDKQVDDSLKRMKSGAEVRKLVVGDRKERVVLGHRAIFSSANLTLGLGVMALKSSKREVSTLHFYCEPTGKFFALYMDAVEQFHSVSSGIFSHMSETLTCHR